MPQATQYYTRFFALSKPPGENVFELLIVCDDQPGVLSKLTGVLASHRVDILSIYGANDPEIQQFVLCLFCDFKEADCPLEQATGELEKVKFVNKIEYVKTDERVFEKFLFPVKVMNRYRAIVMRVDPLLHIEKHLEDVMGSAGASIMFDIGRTYASESMLHYREVLTGASNAIFMQNIIDGLRATGWGIFEFREGDGEYYVRILHPPKLDQGDATKNRFLFGVCAGILEELHRVKLKVSRVGYDEKEDALTLRLARIG